MGIERQRQKDDYIVILKWKEMLLSADSAMALDFWINFRLEAYQNYVFQDGEHFKWAQVVENTAIINFDYKLLTILKLSLQTQNIWITKALIFCRNFKQRNCNTAS